MATFNLADVNWVEIRLFRQLFLGQSCLLTEATNVRSKILPDFLDFFHTTGKQEG